MNVDVNLSKKFIDDIDRFTPEQRDAFNKFSSLGLVLPVLAAKAYSVCELTYNANLSTGGYYSYSLKTFPEWLKPDDMDSSVQIRPNYIMLRSMRDTTDPNKFVITTILEYKDERKEKYYTEDIRDEFTYEFKPDIICEIIRSISKVINQFKELILNNEYDFKSFRYFIEDSDRPEEVMQLCKRILLQSNELLLKENSEYRYIKSELVDERFKFVIEHIKDFNVLTCTLIDREYGDILEVFTSNLYPDEESSVLVANKIVEFLYDNLREYGMMA